MPGSSPENELPTDQVETQVSDASAAAAPSTAETQGEKSLLETVQAALKEGATESSPGSDPDSANAGSSQTETPTAQEDEPLGDLTDEELKRYAPKTQRRMQHLLQQRHEADTRAAGFEEKATRFDQIVGFAETHRLSNEDVAGTFEIAALIKNDPIKAYEKVLPIALHLAQITGAVLPADLQERVNLGYLPEKDAQELARLQSQTKLREQRSREEQEASEEQRKRDAHVANVREAESTANSWEEQKRKSDPDWSSKKELVLELLGAEVAKNGFPQGKAATLKMLDSIEERVATQIARFKPAPREIRPVTGASSARTSAEPKSAIEAAKAALAGAQ